MPAQSTLTDYIFFPDGAQVAIDTGSGFNDIGAISTAVTATLNYDVNEFETANAGKLARQIRNMTMAGSFTLINLDIDRINELGGGMFSVVDTAGSTVIDANITDQTISSGWSDATLYDLDPIVTATGESFRFSTTPVLTSVTLDPTGTPEVLVADSEYVIVENANSSSGYSLQFISSNMATGSPTTFDIVVDFGDNDPIASSTLYCGTSTQVLTAYAMRIRHTDSNSKVRELNLFSVNMDSGGFQFNYKGAQEDGVEEMPLAFTAQIDTSLTDGRQLFSWKVDSGAA